MKTINTLCEDILSKFKISVGKIAGELSISVYLENELINEIQLYEKEIKCMRDAESEFETRLGIFCEDVFNKIFAIASEMLFKKVINQIVVTAIRYECQEVLGKNEEIK